MYYTVQVQKRLGSQRLLAKYLTCIDNIRLQEIDHTLTDSLVIRTHPVEMTGEATLTQPCIGDVLQRPLGMMERDRCIFAAVNDQSRRKDFLQ